MAGPSARLLPAMLVGVVGLFVSSDVEALDVERLASSESALLHSTLQRLEPLISAKKRDGSANLLTWEELYHPLAVEEQGFLDAIRAIKAETLGSTSHYKFRFAKFIQKRQSRQREGRTQGIPAKPVPRFDSGSLGKDPEAQGRGRGGVLEMFERGPWQLKNTPPTPRPPPRGSSPRSPESQRGMGGVFYGERAGPPSLVPVGPQQILKDGAPAPLDAQFLPNDVHEAYETMMQAMERDLGRRLLVESGYRSPAYQLYLFVFYLPTHGESIRETNRHVALPGYSEHGNPQRQAIDFINQDGINGEDRPELFEALPEYAWLAQHAAQFGFYLSYPRDNPHHTAFEPWHWHFESSESVRSE